MTNIIDGILKERDRMMQVKETVGELWKLPEMFFYRAQFDALIKNADEAIAGRKDAIECIQIYKEMQEFET